MLDSVERFLEVWEQRRTGAWTDERQQGLYRLWNEDICASPEAAYQLLTHRLDTYDGGTTWEFADLVDYVAEDKLNEIFERCRPALLLPEGDTEGGGFNLERLCLQKLQWQKPELFHPHLGEVWRRWSDSDVMEGWWDSGALGFEVVTGDRELLESRDPHIVRHVLERTNCIEAFEWLREHQGLTLLEQAGFAYIEGEWRRLYHEQAYHFVFPPEYLEDPNWREDFKPTHPTWHLGTGVGKAEFYSQDVPVYVEKAPEYRLILREVPPGIAATLPLVVEAPEDISFYELQHDERGWPVWDAKEDWDEEEDGEWPDPFRGHPFMTIRFAPTPKRWYRQEDNSQANLSRMGGPGVWRQFAGEYVRSCSTCGGSMPLLLQIGNDHLRGQFWMVSIFWCDTCRIELHRSTTT